MTAQTSKPRTKRSTTKPAADPKARINSRAKGARGEREAIGALARIGVVAMRSASMQAGRQADGAKVPDLVCDAPWQCLWVEAKSTQTASDIFAGLHQAAVGVQHERATQTVPVCLYRANRKPWVLALPTAYLLFKTPLAGPPPVVSRAADAVRLLTGRHPHPVVRVMAKARPDIYCMLLETDDARTTLQGARVLSELRAAGVAGIDTPTDTPSPPLDTPPAPL